MENIYYKIDNNKTFKSNDKIYIRLYKFEDDFYLLNFEGKEVLQDFWLDVSNYENENSFVGTFDVKLINDTIHFDRIEINEKFRKNKIMINFCHYLILELLEDNCFNYITLKRTGETRKRILKDEKDDVYGFLKMLGEDLETDILKSKIKISKNKIKFFESQYLDIKKFNFICADEFI